MNAKVNKDDHVILDPSTLEVLRKGKPTKDEIEKIIEYLAYAPNPIKGALQVELYKNRDHIAKTLGLDPKEICFGDYLPGKEKVCPYSLVLGNVVLFDSNVTDLGKLEKITGNAHFDGSQLSNLGNLKEIGGDAITGTESLSKQFKSVNGKFKRVSNKSSNQDQGQDM